MYIKIWGLPCVRETVVHLFAEPVQQAVYSCIALPSFNEYFQIMVVPTWLFPTKLFCWGSAEQRYYQAALCHGLNYSVPGTATVWVLSSKETSWENICFFPSLPQNSLGFTDFVAWKEMDIELGWKQNSASSNHTWSWSICTFPSLLKCAGFIQNQAQHKATLMHFA